jgi:hypothetical protein
MTLLGLGRLGDRQEYWGDEGERIGPGLGDERLLADLLQALGGGSICDLFRLRQGLNHAAGTWSYHRLVRRGFHVHPLL